MLGLQLSELFADCFATWVAGPCVGLAAAWRGFTAGGDVSGSITHPDSEVRIGQMAQTLRMMPDLAVPAAALAELAVVAGDDDGAEAGDGPPADGLPAGESLAVDPGELGAWCDELRGLLANRLPGGRYASWPRAAALAVDLAGRCPNAAERVPVADVLNAAWWARVQGCDGIGRISRAAWSLLAGEGAGGA